VCKPIVWRGLVRRNNRKSVVLLEGNVPGTLFLAIFQEDTPMIPKFLLNASLAGLLLLNASAPAGAIPQQSSRQNEQSKSTSGKVTDIGKDKKSFSLQTNDQDNSSKRTIIFIVNGDTQIKGQVTVGTDVDVEYRPTPDGNVALVITPRSGGSQ
jgi:hypothetical protein